MNKRTLRLTALALAALMLLSSLWIVVSAAPASYSTISNSGKRGEVCVSLDGTSVSSYYTGDYTFDSLATQSPSNLKSSLHHLMTSNHKKITSYADCRDYVFRVDCEQNDTTHATTLYTSYHMTSADWSPAWACNREHVWPQSLGGNNTNGGGADLHHIRPAEAGVNSSRGNKLYGESKGFYEPLDNVKGDVARIILYVYVRWDADWGATDVTKVFESVDILLEWCEMDPVDTWEMGRNEVVQSIQGNRNAFIDYPELAWHLFGREVPEDMVTPSCSALDGEIPTFSPETETDPPEEETNAPVGSPNSVAVFDFGENGGASHNDGTDITSSQSYTDGDYTLTLTGPNKLYGGARDAKGNSCLKLGSSKATGSFNFKVPDDVDEVIIYAAQYKANKSALTINGTKYTLTTASNNGEYTPLTIDTSKNKTVTVATVSGSTRCMINTIEFISHSVVEPETDPPHIHDYTIAVTAPTCTEKGYTVYTCTTCAHTYQGDEVAALGHDYKDTVTAPTCTEKGYTTHTCSRCNHSYTDSETAALGHSAGDAADCTTDQTCTVCGIVLIGQLGHDYKDTVTAPTCTEKGYTTHTCSRCNDSYTDGETDALGHTAGDWIIDTEAAPGAEGSKHKECTVCGTTLETVVIEALPVETEKPTEETTEEPVEESTEESTEEITEASTEVSTEASTEASTIPQADTEGNNIETTAEPPVSQETQPSADTSTQSGTASETNESLNEEVTTPSTDGDLTESGCSSAIASQISMVLLLFALVPLAAVKRKKDIL